MNKISEFKCNALLGSNRYDRFQTRRKSTYTPDLYLVDSDKWIEIKSWINREQSNKTKY